jgi:hypothetical protein
VEGVDLTVYVVQMQMKQDPDRGLIPRFPSVERAVKWGTLRYMLSPSDHPFNSDHVVNSLHDHLKDFCDDDYLLLIGNPVLMGMASAIAAFYNEGRVKFLQWSGRHEEYSVIAAEIN